MWASWTSTENYRITPTQPSGLYRRRFHQRWRVVTLNLRCRFYIGRCIDDVNLAPVASCVVGIYNIKVNTLRNYPHLPITGDLCCICLCPFDMEPFLGLLLRFTVPLLSVTRNEAQLRCTSLAWNLTCAWVSWCMECNANLAKEKKETKKETKMKNNPVF